MNKKISAAFITWIMYFYMFISSIYEYIKVNPLFFNSDEPLMFGIVLVIFWIERQAIIASIRENVLSYPIYGVIGLCFGLMLYIIGRLYPVIYIEIWGLFVMVMGILLCFSPKKYYKSAIFIGSVGTVFILLGKVAPELMSSELAKGLALVTAKLISATLLPVTANGVTIYFGPYSAEVTHACSGMNSIFSLFALSVLYLREGINRNILHLSVLILFVIPVAVITNLIRVITLVLITWYLGNRYAQGVYHDLAGVFVFIIALILLATVDRILFIIQEKKINEKA
jgi:exosortase